MQFSNLQRFKKYCSGRVERVKLVNINLISSFEFHGSNAAPFEELPSTLIISVQRVQRKVLSNHCQSFNLKTREIVDLLIAPELNGVMLKEPLPVGTWLNQKGFQGAAGPMRLVPHQPLDLPSVHHQHL